MYSIYSYNESKIAIVPNYYNKNYNKLSDHKLDRALSQLPLNEMCNLAISSKRFEAICCNIWSRTPIYQNNIDNQFYLSDEDCRYFICKNAENFTSLQICSSDFHPFDEATKNLELNNLKSLRLIMEFNNGKPLSTDFLNRCKHLEALRICQPTKKFSMNNIFKLNTLKTLEICHEQHEISDLVLKLIKRKGHSIKRIQTHTKEFPPCWLKESAMEKCRYLEDLALGSRLNFLDSKDNKLSLDRKLPTLKSLKNLWITGLGFQIDCVMAFIENCPNLKTFFHEHIEEYEIHMDDIMRKRKTEGNNTPLNLMKFSGITENTTFIEFK